ncbi:DUF2933 domain-containing protein [Candidatus Woesearchaeota archaeon]|nr:DUF2933 domain-containing protein [Candidatus Woesearchaeota archaeon]
MKQTIWEKIKNNHAAHLILFCLLPLLAIFIAIQFFGVKRSYLIWIVLLLCPLSHYFMMRKHAGH